MCPKSLVVTIIIITTLIFSCVNSNKNSTGLETTVDKYIKPYIESGNFSGIIFIAHDGNILHNKGYGMANFQLSIPNTPETNFQIASLSKTFTVAAVLLLQQRDILKVNDPVSRFLPSYPNAGKITIHQLLNHTSGLPRFVFFPDYKEKSLQSHTAQDIVLWIKDKPLAFEPGERSGYSNSNYAMLAYIIELASGMDYGQFLQTNIFDPLNLNKTGHRGDSKHITNFADGHIPVELNDIEQSDFYDYSITIGAGSLYSTAENLYDWYQALISDKLLNRVSLDLMMNQRDDDTSYGWIYDKWYDKDVYKKSGWDGVGFSTQFVHFLKEDLTIIVLMNLNISSITNEIIRNLSAIALGKEYKSLDLISKPITDKNKVKQIIGLYRFGKDFYVPNSSIEIIESNGYLYIKGNRPDQKVGLLQISKNEYIHRQHWFKVMFNRGEDGQIVGLKYGSFEAVKENKM